MKSFSIRFAWLALILAGSCAFAGSKTTGLVHELLISLFGTFGGLSISLFVINFYMDKSERKVAALPLALLIETAVNRLHNDYFIGIAHARFGSTKFGTMISDFTSADREPTAFSPEDRVAIAEMIMANRDALRTTINDLDQRFSTLISVLGWNFDANIIAAALEAKRNASELIAALETDDPDRESRLIKHWFDLDLTAAATRMLLAKVLDIDPKTL